jgi:hypothetical protein
VPKRLADWIILRLAEEPPIRVEDAEYRACCDPGCTSWDSSPVKHFHPRG